MNAIKWVYQELLRLQQKREKQRHKQQLANIRKRKRREESKHAA